MFGIYYVSVPNSTSTYAIQTRTSGGANDVPYVGQSGRSAFLRYHEYHGVKEKDWTTWCIQKYLRKILIQKHHVVKSFVIH